MNTPSPPKGVLLVLEDQAVDFQWISRALQSQGWDVDRAGTETEARQKLDEHKRSPKYSGAILDVMVPKDRPRPDLPAPVDVDAVEQMLSAGVRVARYIREELKLGRDKLPIIFLSILSRTELEEHIKEYDAEYCGKEDYVFDRQALFRLLPKR